MAEHIDIEKTCGPAPEQAGYVSVAGGKIWYRLNGGHHLARGKTALLVVHGGPGMSHHYLVPLVALATDRPVVLYDQLDSGSSERPGDPSNWTIPRFVSEIDSLRAELGLPRVFVFGNSWGGTLAAEYAMRRPEGLLGVVLSSPMLDAARWVADNTAYRRQLPADVQAILDEHEARGDTSSSTYEEAVGIFYARHFCRADPWPPELEASFAAMSLELYKTMWGTTEFNATGTLQDYDAKERLGNIEVPTLYTCGELDECTPDACRQFQALTPGAELEIIDSASHTAFLERRQEYQQIVRRFLNGID